MTSHSKKNSVLWLSLFLGLVFLGNAEAAPVLKATHFPAEVYENQGMQLKLVFEWPASEGNYEIRSPEGMVLDNVKFLGLSQEQETVSSGLGAVSRLILSYDLLPLQKGQCSIDSFVVLYRRPGQGMWKEIPISKLVLEINTALPWGIITTLLLVLGAIFLPFVLWSLRANWIEKQRMKNFRIDPKQEIYKAAVKIFSTYVVDYTSAYLDTLLSGWSGEIAKVIMVCYDIPIREAPPREILKQLQEKNIPLAERKEIEDLLNQLERLKASTWAMTSDEVENMRLSLLQYTNSKLVPQNSIP